MFHIEDEIAAGSSIIIAVNLLPGWRTNRRICDSYGVYVMEEPLAEHYRHNFSIIAQGCESHRRIVFIDNCNIAAVEKNRLAPEDSQGI